MPITLRPQVLNLASLEGRVLLVCAEHGSSWTLLRSGILETHKEIEGHFDSKEPRHKRLSSPTRPHRPYSSKKRLLLIATTNLFFDPKTRTQLALLTAPLHILTLHQTYQSASKYRESPRTSLSPNRTSHLYAK